MRTTIDLNENLIREAFKFSNVRTKKELVHLALMEYVQNRRQRNLADLKGKISFREGYDYKSMRIDIPV